MEFLNTIWQAWKRFGQFLGDIVARIVLTLFYFTVFAPFGAGVTWLSDNPLRAGRADGASMWLDRQSPPPSVEQALKQY